ncbi:MAG: efflux RND transporter periplasmic adaptor subunit [Nitratireductor sp.]|nr:efflux RND transporter periplasmic adaptor subunit [Nitratireductor sp.]MCC0020913.1 efflux RND transporter periplasmic adaptor subunit [Nitratireductor sp.]
MRATLLLLSTLLLAGPAAGENLKVEPQKLTEWKAVYGQIETKDRVPARARIGGTIVELQVTEGDEVKGGQQIALVKDSKLDFQITSLDAQLRAANARLETAKSDLERGKELLARKVITGQRIEQLETAVDVINGEIASLQSQRQIVERQIEEGAVLSPDDGVVLSVPVSAGSVVGAGESIAVIGGGGAFLRLSVPERHTADLKEGDEIEIGTSGNALQGKLVKLYPLVEGGRLQADVEVDGLDARYVGRRVPVRLPVGEREALLVPETALRQNGGLDYVTVAESDGEVQRIVVPGETVKRDGSEWREILTGLSVGDVVVTNAGDAN